MTSLVDSTSTSLIRGIKQHNPLAWERLAQLYSPLVYSWCRKAGVSPTDSADVAQEVFRSVHTHIADFRQDQPGDAFRGWLWTITRNKIRDFFRGCTTRPQAVGGSDAQMQLLEFPDEFSSISDGSSQARRPRTELLRGLEVVQAEFEDRTWQAFWRTTVDDVPTSQVAEELGISVNAVRLAKSRVLRRLREELDGS